MDRQFAEEQRRSHADPEDPNNTARKATFDLRRDGKITAYVIMSQCYDYDDNVYYPTDGYDVMPSAYLSKEKAEAKALENDFGAFIEDVYANERHWVWENCVDDYLENITEEDKEFLIGLNITQDPDTERWDLSEADLDASYEDKLRVMKLFNFSNYIVQEITLR